MGDSHVRVIVTRHKSERCVDVRGNISDQGSLSMNRAIRAQIHSFDGIALLADNQLPFK